jgi:diketogulonate reductase-like aldo/keto reductase
MTEISRRDLLRILGLGATSVVATTACSRLASTSEAPGTMFPSMPAGPILTKPIPSSGETIPVIGLGTSRTFDVGSTAAEQQPLEEVLKAFSAVGGKLIDSSPMYGRAEQVVGDLSAKLGLRPKLFIATKVWTQGAAAGVQQMEESLRKLRADPIDLMQVHNLVDVETQVATLAEWKQKKRIRYVGVTHSNDNAYEAVERVIAAHKVDFLQINYSVLERGAEQRLLPLAKERGIAVIVNRPFARGNLFSRVRSKPLPGWAAEIDCKSWAQVLLKFVVSHPAVTCAIPATSNVEHLRDNMNAAFGRLPEAKLRTQIAMELSAL